MDRETVEEIKRHFGIVAEEVRSEVRAVAEGQDLLSQKVNTLVERFDGFEKRFDGLEIRFGGLEIRFDGFEMRFDGLERSFARMESEFRDVRSTIHLFQAENGRRFGALEADVSDMRVRLPRRKPRG